MNLIIASVNAEKYFLLDVNHIIDSVTFNKVSLTEIDRAIKYSDKSGFLIKTVSFENKDLEIIYHNMSENKNYVIYIPYNKNAERIEIYNIKNSKIIEVDVSFFSDRCGNKKCEEHESYESCKIDCLSGGKDDFCDSIKDGICDPDCSLKTDNDCLGKEENKSVESGNNFVTQTNEEEDKFVEPEKESKVKNNLIWILSISGIVAVILLIFLFIKIRESRAINSLKQYINENLTKGFTIQQIKDALYKEGYSGKEVEKAIKNMQ